MVSVHDARLCGAVIGVRTAKEVRVAPTAAMVIAERSNTVGGGRLG